MDVQNLEFEDNTFDTVVASFVFCSVPDLVRGLMEIERVCRPGGKVVLLEHALSVNRIVGMAYEPCQSISCPNNWSERQPAIRGQRH